MLQTNFKWLSTQSNTKKIISMPWLNEAEFSDASNSFMLIFKTKSLFIYKLSMCHAWCFHSIWFDSLLSSYKQKALGAISNRFMWSNWYFSNFSYYVINIFICFICVSICTKFRFTGYIRDLVDKLGLIPVK